MIVWKSVFGKKSIMQPFNIHRTNVIVRQPPIFLDYLLFLYQKGCFTYFFLHQKGCFLGKKLILFERWMIFTRPPAVEAEAMSLGTLALRPPRYTWICKHWYLWVLFYLYLWVLLTFFLGYRYVIFGLHAAPGFANILMLMFMGDILITMTKIYLSLYIWWSFQVVMKSFYLCVPCAGYCMNEVFEFISSFAHWFWEFLYSFACEDYLFECLHLCIYSFLYIKIQYDAKSVK